MPVLLPSELKPTRQTYCVPIVPSLATLAVTGLLSRNLPPITVARVAIIPAAK